MANIYNRRGCSSPEQLAKAEAVRSAARTPESRALDREIREQFRDRPSLDQLIDRGEVDPARVVTMGELAATRGRNRPDVAHRLDAVPHPDRTPDAAPVVTHP